MSGVVEVIVDRTNGTFSIKCDWCGRFIGMDDLNKGWTNYTPESEFTHEEIEHVCFDCTLTLESE